MSGRTKILVCDDEELIRWSLSEYLQAEGYRVVEAADGKQCLEQVAAEVPDLVVLDIKMPRMGGMEVLQHLQETDPLLPVVVITAHGAVDSALEATRLGARAYLAKPFDLREMGLLLQQVLKAHSLEAQVRYLRDRHASSYDRVIGQSAAMQRLFETLRRLETVDAPTVLLIGESGTGKDLIANAIHENGMRRNGPFMEVDCAGLTETLIESELFGHERGAFTDAKTTKRGLFELARGGTLFLDEITEMSLGTQAKLLRALENRRFKRVGGVADIHIDAGVIAATNRDLGEEVRKGRFREDLFFRLNVVRINIPPLRARREDVPLLAQHFLQRFNQKFSRDVQRISPEASRRLQAYAWPGNVRELRNVLERIVILEAEEVILVPHLPPELRFPSDADEETPIQTRFVLPEHGVDLEALERNLLEQAMARTGGNQSQAARLLGISRYALRYRLEKGRNPPARGGGGEA
ncbi:MAG: sigma-54-dependent Fis family transcriptional regulator [Deltaproteobacteria bacterium]|nr:sigma-54-dependent Fis family transcriptional regulator [Deltaproteobacteria bacterium]